jgi:general secretion pathway protein A
LYQEFYKLKQHPFRLSPDPAFVCMTEQHREALSGLIYSVCTRPGLSVLIGEVGTGKTTILYTLLGLLERRQYLTAICTNPTLSRDEFYEFVLLKFDVNCASTSKTRQLVALEETLKRHRGQGKPAVLIVDEAQRLPTELLEEVRLLLNIETPQEKLLEIVLAGQPELGDTLRRPELRQLKQRVGCVCTLKPLNPEEIGEYINHRLIQAGRSEPPLFSADALELIYAYSGGIPRLINTLADTALRTGFVLEASSITPFIVGDAARELELVRPAAPDQAPVDENDIVACLDAKLRESMLSESSAASNPIPERTVPLESYANRQKSLGFFSQWVGRWK